MLMAFFFEQNESRETFGGLTNIEQHYSLQMANHVFARVKSLEIGYQNRADMTERASELVKAILAR